MSHSNISNPRTINRGTIAYGSLLSGEVIEIVAHDAIAESHDSVSLRIIGFRDETPIFMAGDGDLCFYETDRGRIAALERGIIALGGTAGTHIPQTANPIIRGAIAIGRDWSLNYVDGTNLQLFAHRVSLVQRYRAPQKWAAPKKALREYNAKVDALMAAEQQRSDWREYEGEMTILTLTDTYHVMNILERGERMLSHDKDSKNIYLVRLNSARVGGCLVASTVSVNGVHSAIVSDPIISITPEDQDTWRPSPP
jgi:hypothetical protein